MICFTPDKGALTCSADDSSWSISYLPEKKRYPFVCQFDHRCKTHNPCRNSGLCVPTDGFYYTCDCSKTNYTGRHCEEEFLPELPPRFEAQISGGVHVNTSVVESVLDGITPEFLITIGWMCGSIFLAIVVSIGGGYIICFKRKKAGAGADAAGGGLDAVPSSFGGSQADLAGTGSSANLGSQADLAGGGGMGSQANLSQMGSMGQF